ncbi:uncharacterized protein LOC105207540 isoform X2 [Solenopsis invicta]|nr:uncharacterized protein LOC105207540 isoform X2 [Solenopsis invicta]
MERYSSRFQRIGPKLHKNRRIYDKWGMKYHNKMQDIVFGKHCLPYVPTERPPSLVSEEIVESGPLYVCKQCKDCFRFQSSFEDHNTRHSWILGLWCYICFETICTHITETGSTSKRCCICIHKSCDKRAYLRERGLHKSQRMGAVRVFYNQCQFVEHLKMHNLSSINIADIMLIPLPVDMSNSDWCTEFEILCEALMERAFLLRTHIIDWLKMHNLQDNWWKLVNGKSNDNMINKIVDDYRGRELFETFDKPADMIINFSISNAIHSNKSSPDIEFIDNNSMDKNTDNSSDVISDKNILENDDNPCIPNDITFVDCGPASQCLEPEIPVHYEQKKQTTVQEMKNCPSTNTIRMNNKTTNKTVNDCNLLETNKNAVKAGDNDSIKNLIKPSYKNFVKEYKTAICNKKNAKNNHSKPITKTNVRKMSDIPVNIGMSFPVKKSQITKSYSESLQTSSLNNNSNVLIQGNIQDPKNIVSIISQLPSNFISNKKVVFIGQDSSNVIAHNKNEITTKTDLISLIDNGGTDSNTSTQMCDINNKKQELTGKIIVRNGKKYLIKSTKTITKDPKSSNLLTMENVTKEITNQSTSEHNTSKPKLTSANSKEVENIGVEQTTLLYNNISLLTPSPSPSELSSSSSCDLHVKKNAFMPKLQELPQHLMSSTIPSTPKCILETISLIKEDNGELYMDIKVVDRITRESFREVCDVIVKYRREMFDEFYQMNGLELKERLNHLQCVVEEMKQVLNFQSSVIFNEKLRAVNTLRCILEECIKKCDQDVQEKRNDDPVLNEWETKVNRKYKCTTCNRYMKPKSYVAGFSKLLKNENAYCSCYKQVCHECRSHQGSVLRYVAHQNFHKRHEPYVCPDCNSKFNSFTSLEIHTWTVCFHTAKKYVFTCKICGIDGFKDLESITRHFVVMHSKTKVGCENCSRVFSSYNEYAQHCSEAHCSKLAHTEQKPIRLVICKLSNVILRCVNYISYLEKYPGIRKVAWFKCPFCNLTTTDNKHVTTLLNNHIRENHVEPLSRVLTKKAFEIYVSTILNVGKNDMRQFVTTVSKDTLANEAPCTDGTMLPRIVNTRTISSEIFERGSQEMECTWSTNTDEVIDKNPQIIDTEEKRVLPKINVRSLDDLKSSKPKDSIAKHSTETKKKTNSSSPQVTIETEEMELGNSNEETVHTVESEKDNNELTKTLCESEKSLLIDTVNVNSLIASNKEFVSHFEVRKSKSYKFEEGNQKVSNSTSETNTDSCIKIVDFMTICRPDIEPFVNTEMCNIQKESNARYMVSFPKPPPLVRIPQHLLERRETIEPVNDSNKSNESYAQRMANKSKVRIAIGTHTQEEGDIDYLCHLCNERINTSQLVAQAHFREKHSDEYKVAIITPQLSRMSLDFINGGYKQFINNKKRKSDSTLFAAKRKRRWTPKKHVELKDTNPPAGLCVEQETAEDGEGNFICKKCGQRCVDMSDLREHIAANHRLKGRYLICLECGENFVVAPSLQMHLKAFHGIEDPATYMTQNPSYAPDIDGDLQTEGRTTVANQCYVCMAVFEDKAAVDKHLRVHGMAFLNRKRIEARNALEKKTNTEEDKPNIIKDDSKETAKQDKPTETILDKINAAI